MAADTNPIEMLLNLPNLCEEKVIKFDLNILRMFLTVMFQIIIH